MDKSLSGIAHDHYEEEPVVGYDVQYQYNGRICHTRVDRNPGLRPRPGICVAAAEYGLRARSERTLRSGPRLK